MRFLSIAFVLTVSALAIPCLAKAQGLGVLEGHADVGSITHPGNASFNASDDTYTVTGGGDNLWFTADEMQFAWKRLRGDVALTAQIDFVGDKGNNHRKAALMIRQSLGADSAYADIARHGDGLTSLQFRLTPGDVTREIETAVTKPQWVRLERRGDLVSVFVGNTRDDLRFSGATIRLKLIGDVYVGLAVCSHDKNVTETALFHHFEILPLSAASAPEHLWSTLETVKVASSDRRVAFTAPEPLAAPNWSRDGRAVTFEQANTLQHFDLDPAAYPSLPVDAAFQKKPTPIRTGQAMPLTGSQGVSPDGKQLAFNAGAAGSTHMYLVPAEGGVARQTPTLVGSEWRSWSPDGRTLLFTVREAEANTIYTVPVQGGEVKRLTQGSKVEDPDYSADGQWIYFSSGRSGSHQLWRMRPDGTGSEQVLAEQGDLLDPHPSPDGKYVVYLAMPQGGSAPDHKQQAELRLLSLVDGKSHLLATMLALPGTMPAPSWSPDSTRVTFISYAYLP